MVMYRGRRASGIQEKSRVRGEHSYRWIRPHLQESACPREESAQNKGTRAAVGHGSIRQCVVITCCHCINSSIPPDTMLCLSPSRLSILTLTSTVSAALLPRLMMARIVILFQPDRGELPMQAIRTAAWLISQGGLVETYVRQAIEESRSANATTTVMLGNIPPSVNRLKADDQQLTGKAGTRI